MNRQELQKLRDLPIEGVAERLGLQVTRHKSLCPFHDDHHASLAFNVRRNTCRCFACMNESIGTIDLVMQQLHMVFPDACRWLADEHNVIFISEYVKRPSTEKTQKPFDAHRYERFFEHPWLSAAACRFLFDERQLNPAVIQWCKITSWCDKQGIHWLQIPYYDCDGKLIGVQNRNLAPSLEGRDGERLPRFRFPQGSACSIYNLPVIKMLQEGEPLYITEGCSDCWAMLSAGHKAIAIPSATLLKTADIDLLSTLNSKLSTPFHMYPDQDVPGERLFLQLKERFPHLQRHQLPAGFKDFSDYYIATKKGGMEDD